MDECDACRHIRALHAAATGPCRLNGCPCRAFVAGPVDAPESDAEFVVIPDGRSPLPLALVSALIGFLLGLGAGALR